MLIVAVVAVIVAVALVVVGSLETPENRPFIFQRAFDPLISAKYQRFETYLRFQEV